MRRTENDWLDRPTTTRDKIMIISVIIATFILLNIIFVPFRKFNMHVINYGTYYTEFGCHLMLDKIHGEQTEFQFKPIKIGTINFAVDEQISEIKSDFVSQYNAEAIGDSITKQITGKSMDQIISDVNKGY